MTDTNAIDDQKRRRERYRPPIGVPLERPGWWGVPLAVMAHLTLLLLLLAPAWSTAMPAPPVGAGGAGASGGGGGGGGPAGARANARTSSDAERLRYVSVVPAHPDAESVEAEVARQVAKRVPEPVVEATMKPALERSVERVSPLSQPVPTGIQPNAASPNRLALATGGDSGGSGVRGAGPGTGGGTGTGTGSGRGSTTGSGTGGGEGSIYPATPDFLVMPALPVPSKVRGKTIRLVFKLDERGKILELTFDPTGDSAYDKELRARLLEYRFRPAHKADGTAVPSVYVTELSL